MATRIRIPFVLDLVVVDDAAEMAWLNESRDVSRVLSPAGGLVPRMLHRRVTSALCVGRDPLPAFAARDDPRRAGQQAQLEEALEQLDLDREPLASTVRTLTRYVTAQAADVHVGVAVQQLVGQLFSPTYVATDESYRAAQDIAAWPRANPLKALWWRVSGRLARSRALLWAKAGDDPACIHATAIAMHNLVTAIQRMRALAGEAGTRGLAPREAVRACLAAPPALLRSTGGPVRVPFLARPLRRGSLIVFRLERIHARARDDALAFLRGEWSQCPAHRAVPRLLEEIWAGGTAVPGERP